MADWIGVPLIVIAAPQGGGVLDWLEPLLTSVGTLLAAVTGFLALFQARRAVTRSNAPTLTANVNNLVAQVEEQIRDRQALVDDLGRKKESYERLAALSRPQVDAIVETIGSQLQSFNRSALLLNLVMSAAFFIAGIGVTILVQHIFL
jgi:Flp pilus assembly protein TadB